MVEFHIPFMPVSHTTFSPNFSMLGGETETVSGGCRVVSRISDLQHVVGGAYVPVTAGFFLFSFISVVFIIALSSIIVHLARLTSYVIMASYAASPDF